MADFALSVRVSRDALGLDQLEIATSPDYYLSTQFLGGQVQWTRQRVESVWLDGAVTISAHRQMVTEQIGVEITGGSLHAVQILMADLIAAFTQDSYQLRVTADGAIRTYACEAADYQDMSWTTPRLAGAQGQVLLSVPRQPVAVSGGF